MEKNSDVSRNFLKYHKISRKSWNNANLHQISLKSLWNCHQISLKPPSNLPQSPWNLHQISHLHSRHPSPPFCIFVHCFANIHLKIPLKSFFFFFYSCNFIHFGENIQKYKQLRAEVQQYYFKNATIKDVPDDQFVSLLSDMNFIYHSGKAGIIHGLEQGSVAYFYQWVRFCEQRPE